jgi:hypothetical protein
MSNNNTNTNTNNTNNNTNNTNNNNNNNNLPSSSLTAFERERNERIEKNKIRMREKLNELDQMKRRLIRDDYDGVGNAVNNDNKQQTKEKRKKEKTDAVLLLPSRAKSERSRGLPKVNYQEEKLVLTNDDDDNSKTKKMKMSLSSSSSTTTYDPKIKDGYTRKSAMTLIEKNFPENSVQSRDSITGKITFKNLPQKLALTFKPNLTPKEMIQAGTFGGCYFNPRGGKKGFLKREIKIASKEFPKEWFEGLDKGLYENRVYKSYRNLYKVNAGQDQYYWEEHDWINEQDPRGWFHWFCRFYEGRRSSDDERQIGRWNGVGGEKGRWKNNLLGKIVHSNKRFDDASISPVIRQTMLHWAIEVTERDCMKFAKSKGYRTLTTTTEK